MDLEYCINLTSERQRFKIFLMYDPIYTRVYSSIDFLYYNFLCVNINM